MLSKIHQRERNIFVANTKAMSWTPSSMAGSVSVAGLWTAAKVLPKQQLEAKAWGAVSRAGTAAARFLPKFLL